MYFKYQIANVCERSQSGRTKHCFFKGQLSQTISVIQVDSLFFKVGVKILV